MPGEIGAGHQLTGLRSWCQTCCAPFETRGQMRACRSASENLTDLCFTLDFSSACIYQQHTSFNFTFKDCQPLSSMTLEHYGNEPEYVCKVGILTQSLFIYSGQWAVICMHSNMHISVFSGIHYTVKPYLHLCCFYLLSGLRWKGFFFFSNFCKNIFHTRNSMWHCPLKCLLQ